MSELRAIRIERGPQGFGGPLVIKPTEKKIKLCTSQAVEILLNAWIRSLN